MAESRIWRMALFPGAAPCVGYPGWTLARRARGHGAV